MNWHTFLPGTFTVPGEIFLLFFKKNAEQSENNVEFLKFRKYNTLQSHKKIRRHRI